MYIEDLNQLLEPGYQEMETGYYRLENGQIHVAALTRMPRCNGEMVNWWFGFLDNTEKYKLWHPDDHLLLEWDDKFSPGNYIGATMTIKENMGNVILDGKIRFVEPSIFFDTSRFEEANVGTVICGDGYGLEMDKQVGQIIHFVRNTDFGCEMRSRFWILDASASNFDASTMKKSALIPNSKSVIGNEY